MALDEPGTREQELQGRFTLKDRLNYPYIIMRTILKLLDTLGDIEKSDLSIREVVEALIRLIPNSWKDKEFHKARQSAEITKYIDVRPTFCEKPATLEWCKENGIQPYKKQITYNYYILLSAAIDLLDRRHLLTRREYVEKFTGRRAEGSDISERGFDF